MARTGLIAELDDVLNKPKLLSLFDSALYNSPFWSWVKGWNAEKELTYTGVIH